ncbi:ATPase [Pseudoalteromonas sp. CO325X]|nr:ATPase [Pseudoalteromonas sp. CO325X]
MNWSRQSGNISFQGKSKDADSLKKSVLSIIEDKSSTTELKDRVSKLLKALSEGMYEREEIIAVSLLSALCGQNTFLYGPPGTAKSLISRRIACAFSQPDYFEYLMNRFSTPEDVFGPVSIKALKEDRYTRKTNHYLPKAEIAFLDEIWKSSPAILNTLLTLINERIFRNGEVVEKAPLKALIAASNETPESNQGLEALYDRFIVRLMVGPIKNSDNFDHLLSQRPTEAEIDVGNDLQVCADEWLHWQKQIHAVELSKETFTIIHLIRKALVDQYDELKVYVSDRRWQRAAMLMKASAFFNGNSQTNHSDALLLRHCLWTEESNREAINAIVEQAVKDAGFDTGIDLSKFDKQKEQLDAEIHQELYYSKDIYETEELNGEQYFVTEFKDRSYYHGRLNRKVFIHTNKMKTTDSFNPIDENGNSIDDLTCKFDGQGTCVIGEDNYDEKNFTPVVRFHKGDKKSKVNKRLINSLLDSISETKEQFIKTLSQVELMKQGYEKNLKSVFIPQEKSQIAIQGIEEQITQLQLRIKDCERMESLCK